MSENRFNVSDIRRALKAVRDAGQAVAAVDFPKQGGFRIMIGEPVAMDHQPLAGVNEWDEVLRDAS